MTSKFLILLLLKDAVCYKHDEYTSYFKKQMENNNQCVLDEVPDENSTCWNFNAIGQGSPLQKGCDNEACSEAVCGCDPYCCEMSWDLACRGYDKGLDHEKDNPFEEGCSAQLLCCLKETLPEAECSSGLKYFTSGLDTMDEIKICSNTVFVLEDNFTGVIPHRNITIKCGDEGLSSDNCTFVGGEYQFLFDSELKINVKFEGIYFENSTGAGIAAWGPPESSVSFTDCHWKNHIGYDAVDILYQTRLSRRLKQWPRSLQNTSSSQFSMSTYFEDCSFSHNRPDIGVILNVGGKLTMKNCHFHSNIASGVTIGISQEGFLNMTDCNFLNNKNYFSTIFLDQTSLLETFDLRGQENGGLVCNDLFQEASNSQCLEATKSLENSCNGTCIQFANIST